MQRVSLREQLAVSESMAPADYRRLVWSALQPLLGYLLIAGGLIAIGVAWYGVSGTSVVAKQLPYLASGGLIGIGLIVFGGRLLSLDDIRREGTRLDRLEAMVVELHAVLLERGEDVDITDPTIPPTRPPARAGPRTNGYVALPGAQMFHRPGCELLAGKEKAKSITAATATKRGLSPCPMCEPAGVTA